MRNRLNLDYYLFLQAQYLPLYHCISVADVATKSTTCLLTWKEGFFSAQSMKMQACLDLQWELYQAVY